MASDDKKSHEKETASSRLERAAELVKQLISNGTAKAQVAEESSKIINRIEAAVRHLVESGDNVNATDRDGQTLLHYAIGSRDASGDASAIRILIKYGVDVNARNGAEHTPLQDVISSMNYKMLVQGLPLLLENGANVDDISFSVLDHPRLIADYCKIRRSAEMVAVENFLIKVGNSLIKKAMLFALLEERLLIPDLANIAVDYAELLVIPGLESIVVDDTTGLPKIEYVELPRDDGTAISLGGEQTVELPAEDKATPSGEVIPKYWIEQILQRLTEWVPKSTPDVSIDPSIISQKECAIAEISDYALQAECRTYWNALQEARRAGTPLENVPKPRAQYRVEKVTASALKDNEAQPSNKSAFFQQPVALSDTSGQRNEIAGSSQPVPVSTVKKPEDDAGPVGSKKR